MVQYNNMREKDRIARKGAMLPAGGARLPDGYITSFYIRHIFKFSKNHLPDQVLTQ